MTVNIGDKPITFKNVKIYKKLIHFAFENVVTKEEDVPEE